MGLRIVSPLPPAWLALLALAAAAGCGAGGPMRAADPAQAIEDEATEAQGEVGGVAVRASLGGWRGDPRDLEHELTPVDVTARNAAGRPIRLGPEAFSLVVDGARMRVLTQQEVSRAVSQLAAPRRRPRPPRTATGAVGGSTFPGYDGSDPWGPRASAPANAPVPPLGSRYPSQLASGTLRGGASTSVLLFFDVPARTLRTASLEVDVVAEDGERIGTIRLPFERE